MRVINHVPELLAQKFGGAEKVVLQRVAQDTRLTYSTVLRWVKRDITKIDTPTALACQTSRRCVKAAFK